MTRTGEWEISAVSSRLPDNLGELAYMITLNLNYMYRTVIIFLFWQLISGIKQCF